MNYLGLDTETINGACRLLCLSDESVFKIKSIFDVKRFLKKWKGQDFIAFNADYDIQSLLKYLPRNIIDMLLKGIPVDFMDMKLIYVPDKFFKFGDNVIYDCYQFYHMGLDRAAKKYLGKGKGAVDASKITEKNIYSDKVIKYCIRDAKLVAELLSSFREALPDSVKDVPPLSNAYYSGKYFAKELGDNRALEVTINRKFREVYHGARNEIFERGYYPDGLYYYDISGAYPYEISLLPGMKNPFIIDSKAYAPDADFSVYRVQAFIDNKFISPVLMKTNTLSIYPGGFFDGLVTKPEYERIKDYPHKILSASHIGQRTNQRPFKAKIGELWALRQSVSNPLPIKIIMNSLYGKMASAVPKWQGAFPTGGRGACLDIEWARDGKIYYLVEDIFNSNFVYASHITAKVRCRMYDIVKAFPDDIVAVQTDSVMSKRPLPLRVSDQLGDWKVEKWDEAYVLGSGVYFFRIGDEWQGKFRGFDFPKDRLLSVMKALLSSEKTRIEFPSKRRVSLQEARRINDDSLANIIMDATKKLDINFDKKRLWAGSWLSGREIRTKRITSIAHFHYRPDLQLSLPL